MPRLFISIHMEDRFPIVDILNQTPTVSPSCQWAMFLRNHDELTLEMVTDEERDYMYRAYAHEPQMRLNLGIRRRLAPLCGNDRRKMELLDALLFSMPGTPVLYYGDELGMGDNVYLGDRNGVRTPMQWSPDRNAGFSRANPQRLDLPVVIDSEYHYEALNVEAQQSNPNSLLWWTKRLVALRKRYRAFGRGSLEFLSASNPSVLAFVRVHEEETILVVANLSRRVQCVELDLSAMKGRVPVELMGRTRFPPIGEEPYLLTLGKHDFYWFSVEAPRGPTSSEKLGRLVVPTLSITSINELLFGSERPELESVLPAFLDARGWLVGAVTSARVVDAAQIGDKPAAYLVFVRVEYADGESDAFVLPMTALSFDPELAEFVGEAAPALPGSLVANLRFRKDAAQTPSYLLVLASAEGAGRILLDAIVSGASFRTRSGAVVAERAPGPTFEPEPGHEARELSSDPVGASVAYGTSLVLRLFRRSEEGTAAELEDARFLERRGFLGRTPRVLGWVEHRVTNTEPVTLAMLEEQIANEGTAWQQACSEIERAYEHVLAHATAHAPPGVPRQLLVDLAGAEAAGADRELVGTYRPWAEKLGTRVAELHLALASSMDPAFEPRPYSSMDQRAKYQSARNLMGRVLGSLRHSFDELPASVREPARRVLEAEGEMLSRFEPLKTHPIDAKRIRIHGDLHLGRVLFTGKDYVLLGVGGARRRGPSERKRKASALRDVASVVRSFQYAALTSIGSLRPEDQARAEPWGATWARWASAAFLRGYLGTAGDAPFVSRDPAVTSVLLETALLDQALRDLRSELRSRSETIAIPLYAILDALDQKPF